MNAEKKEFTGTPVLVLLVLTTGTLMSAGSIVAIMFERMGMFDGVWIGAVGMLSSVLALGFAQDKLAENFKRLEERRLSVTSGLGRWVVPGDLSFTFVWTLGMLIASYVILGGVFDLPVAFARITVLAAVVLVAIHWIALALYPLVPERELRLFEPDKE